MKHLSEEGVGKYWILEIAFLLFSTKVESDLTENLQDFVILSLRFVYTFNQKNIKNLLKMNWQYILF